jgi:hypothetical protein
VPGERREVDVEVVEIDGLVRYGLAGVQYRQRADGLGPCDQFAYRRERAGDVRMMAEGNDFDALIESQRVQVDAPLVGDAVPAQRGPGATGELLPRDQVGVVLELGDDNNVAGSDAALETVVAQRV